MFRCLEPVLIRSGQDPIPLDHPALHVMCVTSRTAFGDGARQLSQDKLISSSISELRTQICFVMIIASYSEKEKTKKKVPRKYLIYL